MQKYLELLKSTRAYGEILKDFSGGRPAHAYLLVSRDRAALSELADLLATAALCGGEDKPCLRCRACRNTMGHVHPDVKYLPERDARLGVEEIAAMIEDMSLSGMESRNKVYIVSNASAMLPSAQNKLLKSLEEPPSGVTVVLLADNDANLLVTVRSRVRQINLESFPAETIAGYLTERYGDAERARAIAVCADGLLGRADEMYSSEEYYNMYNDMYGLLAGFTTSPQVPERGGVLAKYREHLPEALSLLQLVLRDALMARLRPEGVMAKNRGEELGRISADYPQASLIAAIGKVGEAREKLYFNCNVTAVLDKLLFDILEERAKCKLS